MPEWEWPPASKKVRKARELRLCGPKVTRTEELARVLRLCGPATDAELAAALGVSKSVARSRAFYLRDWGEAGEHRRADGVYAWRYEPRRPPPPPGWVRPPPGEYVMDGITVIYPPREGET